MSKMKMKKKLYQKTIKEEKKIEFTKQKTSWIKSLRERWGI